MSRRGPRSLARQQASRSIWAPFACITKFIAEAEWGVSRTMVTAAYEQLIAEGYLETRQRARARVAQGLE